MLRKFASLKEPAKYGYAYDTDCYNSKAFFSDKFRMFETYGDGLCQHSREWAVQVEFLADYLASLATAMLTDGELALGARFDFHAPKIKDIEFAASVIFKPEKNADGADLGYEKHRRWFSVEERKISASPAKQYDKRYQPLEPWCDGKPDAIYRMLMPEFGDGMWFYGFAEGIRDWCQEDYGKDSKRPYWYDGLPAQFLKWFGGDHKKAVELRYAYHACLEAIKCWESKAQAEAHLYNLHWDEKAADESTEAA